MKCENCGYTNPPAMFEEIPEWERPVVIAICEEVFALDLILSIHNDPADPEDFSVCRSLDDCSKVVGECEHQIFRILPKDDRSFLQYPLGWFSLIYDNGSEGEGLVVVSDYSANDLCETIYQKAAKR